MLYAMLIQTFKDGEWLLGIFLWIMWGIIFVALWAGLCLSIDAYQWSKVTPFDVPAILISKSYKGSTLQTHSVPVATGKGVGVGMVTTGESEKYITMWDCGKYGTMVSEDENVFRLASGKQVLWIKEKEGEYRISGIKE